MSYERVRARNFDFFARWPTLPHRAFAPGCTGMQCGCNFGAKRQNYRSRENAFAAFFCPGIFRSEFEKSFWPEVFFKSLEFCENILKKILNSIDLFNTELVGR